MKTSVPFKATTLWNLKPGAVFSGRMFRGELVRFLRVVYRADAETLGAVAIGPYWADENIVHYYDNSALDGIDCFFDETDFVNFSVPDTLVDVVADQQFTRKPGSVHISSDGNIWLTVRRSTRHLTFVNVATGELNYELNTRSCAYIDRYRLVRMNSEGREIAVFDSSPGRPSLEVAA